MAMPHLGETQFKGAFPLSVANTRLDGVQNRNLGVSDSTRADGMIVGNVTVKKSGILDLHGMITGDLIIEHGGVVYLHGMVAGTVTANGALAVFGMICGQLIDKSDAPVHLAFGSSTRGSR
jgi:cytoskeletal protein CcmA (bactofilin family)